jgi:leader peptidase (prepilin peptidase)/N-methyltransferase
VTSQKEREDLEVFSFIFGGIIGLFLNQLIIKLPKYEFSITKYEGNSSYFIVELISAILTTALYFKLGFSQDFFLMIILSYVLIVLSFIDFKYKAVPDYLLLLVLVLSFFTTNFSIIESFKNAFLFSGAVVLLNFVVTFYIQNIKSRILKDETLKEQVALGEGDIPIIAMIAVILGATGGIFAIFLGAFFAIIPSIYSNILKKDIQTPFIPYLVLGFLTEYFFNIESFIKAF